MLWTDVFTQAVDTLEKEIKPIERKYDIQITDNTDKSEQ